MTKPGSSSSTMRDRDQNRDREQLASELCTVAARSATAVVRATDAVWLKRRLWGDD